MNLVQYKNEWFSNIKGDILAGIVVALALIPEAISFAILAGVDPMVGLYASFCLAVVTAFVGGRPGMISAATGAMALPMVTLVAQHGVEYLLAATILTGIIQFILGVLKFGEVMKIVPRSVMIGFMNALAIVIFTAQLTQFKGASWPMYLMVAGGLCIIYLFPRITKAVPSPLVAIIVITTIAIISKSTVRTVGDMGELTRALPIFRLPNVPFTFETLKIILPYSLTLSIVGLLDSLLVANIVDDVTDTKGDKHKECRGQGIANIVAGCFGGMAGCGMVGQSVVNTKSNGRGRLSTFVAGMFLMVLILLLGDVVVKIPMAALVAVMIMVSISTFDWNSLRNLTIMPKTDATVMVVTVLTVLYTSNLAIGVLAGVVLSAIFFAIKISKVHVYSDKVSDKKVTYRVTGQIFFASVTDLMESFDFKQNIEEVDINFSKAHIWDDSAVGAIDKIVIKFHQNGIKTNIIELNKPSHHLIDKLAIHNKPGGLENVAGH